MCSILAMCWLPVWCIIRYDTPSEAKTSPQVVVGLAVAGMAVGDYRAEGVALADLASVVASGYKQFTGDGCFYTIR
jgi:hypothetical protein